MIVRASEHRVRVSREFEFLGLNDNFCIRKQFVVPAVIVMQVGLDDSLDPTRIGTSLCKSFFYRLDFLIRISKKVTLYILTRYPGIHQHFLPRGGDIPSHNRYPYFVVIVHEVGELTFAECLLTQQQRIDYVGRTGHFQPPHDLFKRANTARGIPGTIHQTIAKPPLTLTIWPVVHADRSEDKSKTVG